MGVCEKCARAGNAMLINLKNEMMHDSTLQAYRDPFGAVTTGTPLTLRFRTRAEHISNVYLCLQSEAFREEFRMSYSDGFWEVRIDAPLAPDIYWYYFTASIEGKTYYYGTEGKQTGGIGCVYTEPPPAYQLTVYRSDFSVPEWFQKSVMYQIFPDRFKRSADQTAKQGLAYHKSKGRKTLYHKDWNEKPVYRPLPGQEHFEPCDYFGGTLKGIEDSLEYLSGLGIGMIYLNPIFEAASNHRYNTADYKNIDPVLGTNEDFSRLCEKAQSFGIRIMLDGVFSHTGSDSIYFNREGAYANIGAYNSQDSPYYRWYTFESYPDKYKCWWGFESLPEVNENDEDWQRFIILDEDSVLRRWIKKGASGYRLDVADELPDHILEKIYHTVKQEEPEGVVLGEVWEDATTKHSYGEKRRYALGGMLDSVTNYPLRDAIVDFLKGCIDAMQLRSFLIAQAGSYPKPMYYALMNLLSSHDIERIRTALSTRLNPHELSREQQALFHISSSQNKKGAGRQLLAVTLQMALPGVPCVYYGDEKGMNGFLDPFNRETFKESPYDLTQDHRRLIALRKEADAFLSGHAAFYAPHEDCIGILRYIFGGRDALGQESRDGLYFVVINRSDNQSRFVVDFLSETAMVPTEMQKALRPALSGTAVCRITQKEYKLNDGLLEMSLDGGTALWLKFGLTG